VGARRGEIGGGGLYQASNKTSMEKRGILGTALSSRQTSGFHGEIQAPRVTKSLKTQEAWGKLLPSTARGEKKRKRASEATARNRGEKRENPQGSDGLQCKKGNKKEEELHNLIVKPRTRKTVVVKVSASAAMPFPPREETGRG